MNKEELEIITEDCGCVFDNFGFIIYVCPECIDQDELDECICDHDENNINCEVCY